MSISITKAELKSLEEVYIEILGKYDPCDSRVSDMKSIIDRVKEFGKPLYGSIEDAKKSTFPSGKNDFSDTIVDLNDIRFFSGNQSRNDD